MDLLIYLILCVDDILIETRSIEHIKEIMFQIIQKFEMKDLGPKRRFWTWKLVEIEE